MKTSNRHMANKMQPTSLANKRIAMFLAISTIGLALFVQTIKADSLTGNVATGTNPSAVAVNPVTNKTYVTNINSNNVTVKDRKGLI